MAANGGWKIKEVYFAKLLQLLCETSCFLAFPYASREFRFANEKQTH